ncbi:gamma-glutamylcyclotransferase family protein [Salinigranum marinum]|uniref:gamma-glutamylcyclotransferase family protein n=1 Tax=Salinigranum marinum TaxID=1515595 RepID=UPI002989A6FC|nr:gamma-glutamylcyclotransferase family protein [Salinigranum marinum]
MDVFVYGTLTAPDQVARVVDSYAFVGPARLHGLHIVEGRYPTLAPGGRAAGRLLRTDDLERLDAHGGVDSGLYVRVSLPLIDGGEVAVYVGDPDRLDADADWPGRGPFADRVRGYLADADVSVEPLVDR